MAEIEGELALLRYLWGGAYRITWDGQFRATHIDSGESFTAKSASELRVLLLAHRDKYH